MIYCNITEYTNNTDIPQTSTLILIDSYRESIYLLQVQVPVLGGGEVVTTCPPILAGSSRVVQHY
jgi:hypothetical protein